MNAIAEPLIQDEYTGEPASKRMLAYLQNMREKGKMIAGAYCAYAPAELIRALDMVPASLCAFSQVPIEAAETILPTNLCPLIKSSFGFILTDTCPFYGIADVVIGETTCDGKKKMFELIRERKPTHIMDLPQLPDEPEALDNWTVMIRKLQSFLETTLRQCLGRQGRFPGGAVFLCQPRSRRRTATQKSPGSAQAHSRAQKNQQQLRHLHPFSAGA